MTDPIEYFYSAHSAFAYLGSRAFLDIARKAGRTILHKPYDLRKGVAAARGPGYPGLSDAQRAYFFGREIDRWAEYRGAPVMGHLPTCHHHEIETSNCLVIAAQEAGADVDALAHRFLEAHWRDDADLADPARLRTLVAEVGLDAEALMVAARSPGVRAIYAANTEEAIRRSVFGAPTYVVDGDPFYGQDHLALVERALVKPFA